MGGEAPPDPYEVLGLSRSDEPSPGDIRKAYHKLARMHHPDKAPADMKDEADARFKEIGAAYALLSDPKTRERYDTHGHDDEYEDPREWMEAETHARMQYCAAMGVPETIVCQLWCTLEELFTGTRRHEQVETYTIESGYRGMPGKETVHFHVIVRPGWRDGREIRIGALGTNRLQSVVFVVRELRHPYFSRPRDKTSADVLVRFALTKEQHEAGAIVSVPTLTGRPLKLSIKANSAVAANGGDKRIANEGFPIVREDHQTSSSPPYPPGTSRGDMIVKLRVQGTIETWLRRGKRMWYAKALGYTVGGVGVVYVSLGLLAFALDIEGCRTGRQRRIPDVLLLSNFPGSYGVFRRFGRAMFWPSGNVSGRILDDWDPAALGMRVALECGWCDKVPAASARLYDMV